VVKFVSTWVTVVVVLFVLNLTYAIFSPIIHTTLNDLVLIHLYNAQQISLINNFHGDQSAYYASLNTARAMVVGFFDLFPYILSAVVLIWAVLQSLRREDDSYY
jgi:hypothetical protein